MAQASSWIWAFNHLPGRYDNLPGSYTHCLRYALLAELHPRPLAFFSEHWEGFTGWPDVPGAYLQFTASYASAGQEAQALQWAYRYLQASHFHMLVHPNEVTSATRAQRAEVTSPSKAT